VTGSPQSGVRGRHAGIWLAALVLLAAVASALLAGSARSASRPQGLIAFTREHGVYVMRPDGRGIRRIWNAGSSVLVTDLSWSRDGEKLAVVTVVDGTEGSLYVMTADGSRGTSIGVVEAATAPSWSPDSRRMAVALYSYRGQNIDKRRDIWIVNTDGSVVRRLAPHKFGVFSVDWSPDGRRFVFGRAGWFGDVWVMSTSGHNLRKLTPGGRPAWSPDGRRIAFEDRGGIWTVNPNGRARTQVTSEGGSPAWSPDGRRIAFSRSGMVLVMNSDGTGIRRLTEGGAPHWQPIAAPE